MAARIRIALIALFVTSLVGVGAWAVAQGLPPKPVSPTVFSGADVGFRVDGHRTDPRTGKDIAVGQVVVRINGQWVDGQIGSDLQFK